MRNVFVLILLWILSVCLQAQTLSGSVYDSSTKQPINKVSVFLDGTLIQTVTDEKGRFELSVDKEINTSLVLYHVSYYPVKISNPFNENLNGISMKERVYILNEVVVEAEQFTRAQKMDVFRKQFLGETKAGKSCRIVNEDDIELVYDLNLKRLSASSERPLIILNNYLKYRILFSLDEFWVQYSMEKTLEQDYIRQSLFAGTSLFIDLDSTSAQIKKRRDDIYKHTYPYFFRNFANHTLDQTGYLVFNNNFPVDPSSFFTIKDTLSLKQVQLIPDTDICKKQLGSPDAFGIIDLLYNKKIRSAIYFYTESFMVDSYGNINNLDKVIFSGALGKNRAGDILPLNYELSP